MDGYAAAAAALATWYLFLVVWAAVVGGRRGWWAPWAAGPSQQQEQQGQHAGGRRGVLLVVVAHPDDEAMFMAPCLAVLASEYEAVHFLSLSSGGAYGLGAVRTQELRRSWAFFFGGDRQGSCERLSPAACVRVADDARLQDGLHTVWDEAHAASLVRHRIAELVADGPSGVPRVGLLTFDEAGVSGHPNHGATHRAVRMAAAAEAADAGRAYELVVQYVVSVPRVLKFSGAAGATLSMRGTEEGEVARTFRVWNPLVCLRSMMCHWSQMVWYRWLFIAFSRYTFAVDVVATRHPPLSNAR